MLSRLECFREKCGAVFPIEARQNKELGSFRDSIKTGTILAAIAAALTLPAAARAASVVELFTSQGCSSCPPADELLAKLAHEPNLIALSLPVDYWDYLGWKDTFAQPAFTARQRAYAVTRGDREVYTPQAVVNGAIHANGASRSEIARAVAQTQPAVEVVVTLAKSSDGGVEVTIPASTGSGVTSGSIVAMPVIGQREVAIGRGENARRKVVYSNIVRDLVPLGRWSGARATYTVPAATLAGADSLVVIVDAGGGGKSPGPIAGAAQLALH